MLVPVLIYKCRAAYPLCACCHLHKPHGERHKIGLVCVCLCRVTFCLRIRLRGIVFPCSIHVARPVSRGFLVSVLAPWRVYWSARPHLRMLGVQPHTKLVIVSRGLITPNSEPYKGAGLAASKPQRRSRRPHYHKLVERVGPYITSASSASSRVICPAP